ncbi:MAG: imidazole glycerol phosphate synthase subunit HisH [Acidobacteria bacterium]|nr:imidazole glycerol phosphate synthase subunit HisH [Acidobacteriota bacterium]
MRIALVDYGAGNLTSVHKALRALGAEVFIPLAPAELHEAAAVVIPGVGHFAATAALDNSWRAAVMASVASGRALLGICLGQQWLFEGSSEAPDLPGLGLFQGRSVRLDEIDTERSPVHAFGETTKIPHVGWNDVRLVRPSALLTGLTDGAQAYFTHSYAVPVTGAAIATTVHGAVFASAVEHDRVFGVQFHPEKSGDVGLTLLANFLRIAEGA